MKSGMSGLLHAPISRCNLIRTASEWGHSLISFQDIDEKVCCAEIAHTSTCNSNVSQAKALRKIRFILIIRGFRQWEINLRCGCMTRNRLFYRIAVHLACMFSAEMLTRKIFSSCSQDSVIKIERQMSLGRSAVSCSKTSSRNGSIYLPLDGNRPIHIVESVTTDWMISSPGEP
jgi:hypothetical protein